MSVRSRDKKTRWVALWLVHVLAIATVVTAATVRIRHERTVAAVLPPLREVPLEVGPLYDYPVVVSDEQLRRVLGRLLLIDHAEKTDVNHVDHALRFWGAGATFDRPGVFSGQQMRGLLTDHRQFVSEYGPDRKPLLIDDGRGVRVRVNDGLASSSHVDHTMAGLAEVGTPLDFPVVTPLREATYGDIVRQALRDFSLNQDEYEWSAVTFALLVASDADWITSEGQRMSFDRIARRLMRQEMPQGVCFGNHRLHALAVLLRVDEQTPTLSPAVRQEVVDYLCGMTRRLVLSQHADGYWNGNWPHHGAGGSGPATSQYDSQGDRILATGHALEWWALAPEEVQPPRHVVARAGQWLARTIEGLSAEEIQSGYPFLTHAGRALALWRGVYPEDVDLGDADSGQIERVDAAAQTSSPGASSAVQKSGLGQPVPGRAVRTVKKPLQLSAKVHPAHNEWTQGVGPIGRDLTAAR